MDFFSTLLQDYIQAFALSGKVLRHIWYVIFPVTFYILFKELWMDHVQGKFASSIDYVMLEIIPPRDIEKGPKPMEAFFSGLSGAHKGFSAEEAFIKGMFMHKFSLEIVSDGGSAHIYVRAPKAFRNLVEANLYAQYPTMEIREVEDYVQDVPAIVPNRDWDLFGFDFELTKPDAYPIRTYRKFEETVTGEMIDPLGALMEAMSKVPYGQKIWYQIIVAPQGSELTAEGKELIDKLFKGKTKPKKGLEKFKEDIVAIFSNIIPALMGKTIVFEEEKKKDDQPIEFKLTPGEKDVLKAIEENIGKLSFRVKMRFIYLGLKEGFDRSHISSFVGAIKQFNDENLNGFKPEDTTKTYANYVFKKSRLAFRQRQIFSRYLKRNMSDGGPTFVLTSEELATIFHLPDMSVASPAIMRVEAKRGVAPSNLPI